MVGYLKIDTLALIKYANDYRKSTGTQERDIKSSVSSDEKLYDKEILANLSRGQT